MPDITMSKENVWAALAAPLPREVISWRQDGRPVSRDGRHIARFVGYIEANTVRERLDSVVPGEWDLTLTELPPVSNLSDDANQLACNFKARLQILGVIREDVGTGKDYKQASTDAFKRVAVRFGIGHELYDLEPNWVQMDGDGKYAKPIEDPAVAYERRYGKRSPAQPKAVKDTPAKGTAAVAPAKPEPAKPEPVKPLAAPEPSYPSGTASHTEPDDRAGVTNGASVMCPKCEGPMWDNRLTKRNPKAPDFKCRDRSCDGVYWPNEVPKTRDADDHGEFEGSPGPDDDDMPF